MKKQKRGSVWIWGLIILVLIAIGIGLYIWLSSDGSSVANGGNSLGNSIPTPPALPS